MIKVVMIVRSTIYSVPGGDTVQVTETARHLSTFGVDVTIKKTNEAINYDQYELLHFFNITRPADMLCHIKKSRLPFVVSTILVEYHEYDRLYRRGIAGFLFRFFSADGCEYIKTISRWLLGRDRLMSKSYLWKGQRNSIKEILGNAAMVLPNSQLEYKRLVEKYDCEAACSVVPNGIDTSLFAQDKSVTKDPLLVLCVARIEGIKNQLNLVKALSVANCRLLLIGSPAPNQLSYYQSCREVAGDNVVFLGQLTQTDLLKYYQQASVHVLPSWFETTGLSSLEAAAMGCKVVISERGDAREYFDKDAFYCNPASIDSIRRSVEEALSAPFSNALQQKIVNNYTWQHAAKVTVGAYQIVKGIS